MTAFSAAMGVIFADANMAVEAVWREQNIGPDVPCRVIRRQPDQVTEFGGGRFRSTSTLADVQTSAIGVPRDGDLLIIGGEWFKVQGDPLRDTERLVWTLDLVPW